MRETVLDIVQTILSAMDSDNVNSINDTVESYQVAVLLKNLYYDIAVDLNLPNNMKYFELNSSTDINKPVLMTLPENVMSLSTVQYNNKLTTETTPNYKNCTFLPLEVLMERQQAYRESDDNDIGVMEFTSNGETLEIIYKNDKMPEFYSILSGNTVVFDSFDSSEDTTLQKSKTLCYGSTYPAFVLSDTYIPEMDPSIFPFYINRAKVRAFSEIKQVTNAEAAGEARRQKIVVQKRKTRTSGLTPLEQSPRRYGK